MNPLIRANAMIAELQRQRNEAHDRCAAFAADLAEAKDKIAGLERTVEAMRPKTDDKPLP
jgi:peptidoglycan hydrolase CwlO-like protein